MPQLRMTLGGHAEALSTAILPDSTGIATTTVAYCPFAVIFAQGEPSDSVMYIQKGAVRLSVMSHTGKEAIVAMLGPRDFLGESALAGQAVRTGTATAISETSVLVVPKGQMIQLLHDEPAFAGRFIDYMLSRNVRIQEDIVDHLFNSSEQRLARMLLLIAGDRKKETRSAEVPYPSQEELAEMIGTTRSRVNFFMNKFRRLGFIDYDDDGLTVNASLQGVVTHLPAAAPPRESSNRLT